MNESLASTVDLTLLSDVRHAWRALLKSRQPSRIDEKPNGSNQLDKFLIYFLYALFFMFTRMYLLFPLMCMFLFSLPFICIFHNFFSDHPVVIFPQPDRFHIRLQSDAVRVQKTHLNWVANLFLWLLWTSRENRENSCRISWLTKKRFTIFPDFYVLVGEIRNILLKIVLIN